MRKMFKGSQKSGKEREASAECAERTKKGRKGKKRKRAEEAADFCFLPIESIFTRAVQQCHPRTGF